ncbi:MAG: Holliday junction branch migration protein RuvA [Pseudomonadota bacterium]
MIAYLTGTLASKSPDHCVIDVGGVGYRVLVSLTTFSSLPEIGAKASVNVHTHVREDQLSLFGFATADEKTLFQRLISISGVGPKTALAILSGIPASDLVQAIAGEDRARLSTIPGIGKKTAERIIIELKDKLAREMPLAAAGYSVRGRAYEDAVSALTNLGYQRAVAETALRKAGWSDNQPIEDSIRAALKELCRV